MKAAVIHEFGDFAVLKLEDVPTPKPRPGHVLVKVLAAGVNRLDHYIREGSIVAEPRLGRWFAAIGKRPAVIAAYAKGRAINTTPTITEDSKAVLLGQGAEARAA